MKFKLKKVYKGPFKLQEAMGLVEDLKKVANPDVNGMYGAKLRKRSNKQLYDVIVKIENDENR